MNWKFWTTDERAEHRELEITMHKKRISDLEDETRGLSKERFDLKLQVEDLKAKHKAEDETMRHLVKMKDEKREIEFTKREAAEDRKRDGEIGKVKDGYRDKVEKNLNDQLSRMQIMYGEVLARLPDVKVRLNGGV